MGLKIEDSDDEKNKKGPSKEDKIQKLDCFQQKVIYNFIDQKRVRKEISQVKPQQIEIEKTENSSSSEDQDELYEILKPTEMEDIESKYGVKIRQDSQKE